FNGKDREVNAPQFILFKYALSSRYRKSFSLGFKCCGCKCDMEQRTLAITQFGQPALQTFFIRRKGEFSLADKLLKAIFNEPQTWMGICICFMYLLPPFRKVFQ